MFVQPDKVKHTLAGLLAGLTGVALATVVPVLAGRAPDLIGAASGALIASTVAGFTKEVADYQDNKIQSGMHGVELADALATAVPGWLLALLLVALKEVM